jgi:Zn-dependent oligopeptidase
MVAHLATLPATTPAMAMPWRTPSRDMATVFEQSSGGFLDVPTGLRLREEIYSVGNSRDVNVSIEKFLGRPRSIEPFLKHIGVKTDK